MAVDWTCDNVISTFSSAQLRATSFQWFKYACTILSNICDTKTQDQHRDGVLCCASAGRTAVAVLCRQMLHRAPACASTGKNITTQRMFETRQRSSVRMRSKMYVPSDSFGGISPEKKASQALQGLFTFISAKIVLAQLEGSGRGALAAYNQEQYTVLFNHLQETSLSDPHKWLEQLMRKDKALALRLMEVRDAYSKTDFEWDQLQRLSIEAIKQSNLQLMRQAAAASLQATVSSAEQQTVPAQAQQGQEAVQTETAAQHEANPGVDLTGTSTAGSKGELSSECDSRGNSSSSTAASAPESAAGPDAHPSDNQQ